MAAHRGQVVAEGEAALAVLGRGRDGEARLRRERGREQGDEGEQAEQAGCRAHDGEVGPLPLCLDAQVVAYFAEGHFKMPALHEPAHDLQQLLRGIGA